MWINSTECIKMTDAIWIFQSVVHGGLIARRDPHYYQYILDPATGEDTMLLTSGEMIDCPMWETVKITSGNSYGTYKGNVYDITDLVLPAVGSTGATTG
jgi:hypothetical protein